MPTVTFLESGGDATQDQSFWPLGWNSSSPGNEGSDGNGALTLDSSQSHTGSRSIKSTTTATNSQAYVVTPNGVVVDAGAAISFWVRFSTVSPSVKTSFCILEQASDGPSVFGIGLNTNTGSNVNGSTTLSATTWYRITISYFITSVSNWAAKVYINGVLEFTMNNLVNSNLFGSMGTTGCVVFGQDNIGTAFPNGAIMSVWFDDIYIDNRTDQSDPGNISVTAKRPFANGTTNGFSTTGTPSGYGSGHASYVNGNYPVGSDTTTYVSVVVIASAITEEFNIEGSTVGDVSLSGATIKGVQGWIFASSTLTETDKILVDGTQTSISVTSTPTLFTQNSPNPTTYPAGTGTDIGMVTNTTAATAKLFGAGILIAYIPGATTTGTFSVSDAAGTASWVSGIVPPYVAEPLGDLRPAPFLPGSPPSFRV